MFQSLQASFFENIDEGESKRKEMLESLSQGKYEEVSEWMRDVRSYDLNLVDRSDFIIAHLIPDVASWGSAEELVTAVRMKKPIFLSIEGGKEKNPPLDSWSNSTSLYLRFRRKCRRYGKKNKLWRKRS